MFRFESLMKWLENVRVRRWVSIIYVLLIVTFTIYLDFSTKQVTRTYDSPTIVSNTQLNFEEILHHNISNLISKLDWGKIAFNNPKKIAYGDKAIIQLLLSSKNYKDNLIALVREKGESETVNIKISSKMEASLGGSSFQITPITPEIQAVNLSGVTEWKWEIKPKELGRQRLFLTLNALIWVKDIDIEHTIKTFDRVIEVNVMWPNTVFYFLSEYWQWLCSAIAIPILIWALNKNWGKKDKIKWPF